MAKMATLQASPYILNPSKDCYGLIRGNLTSVRQGDWNCDNFNVVIRHFDKNEVVVLALSVVNQEISSFFLPSITSCARTGSFSTS